MFGATTYRISIVVEGQDRASGALGGISGALQRMGDIAGGIIGARFFERIASGIVDLAGASIQATADYQRMQVGLEGLLARELSRGEVKKQLVSESVNLSAKERLELIDLQKTYDGNAASLNQLKEAYDASVRSSGEFSVESLNIKVKLDAANESVQSLTSRMNYLTDASDGSVNALKDMVVGGRSIAEVYPEAQGKAKLLMDELSRIAILSPYQIKQTQETFRTAMAFGFASDEALKFTKATLNVAAGVGADSEMLQRMEYNLAQVRLQGKVTAMDVRQLALAGFDLNSVLQYTGKLYGVNIKDHLDFNKAIASGKITWQQFTEAYAKYADENFGGASERMARTLFGLQSTFGDFFNLTMPKILGPAAQVITDFLNKVLDSFIAIRESGQLEVIGENLRIFAENVMTWIGGVFDFGQKLFDIFNQVMSLDIYSWTTENSKPIWDLKNLLATIIPPEIAMFIAQQISGIVAAFGRIRAFWDENGEQIIEMVNTVFTSVAEFIGGVAERVIPFLVEQFYRITIWVNENSPLILAFADTMIQAFQWIMDKVLEAWNWIEPLLTGLIDLILNLAKIIMQVATGDWTGAWNTMKSAVEGVIASVTETITKFWTWLQGIVKDIQDALSKVASAKGLQETKIEGYGYIYTPEGTVIGGGRAGGGPVYAGQPVKVGEKGWEIFNPWTNGTIIPHNVALQMGGQGYYKGQNPVTVQVYASVQNGMDVESLTYRIVESIRNNS